TLRRHMEAHHPKRYNKWCERNDFLSMLPKTVHARRDALAAAAASTSTQQTLDGHVHPIDPAPRVIKYSDALFQQVAEEWLIATNQPIEALSHPRFHEMIEVAARATDGVKIPEKRAVRESILRHFRNSVKELRDRLNIATFISKYKCW
ncbi:hypothetical protein DFP72DRAFT_826137, partial [Ephemerocybe angulata]